MFLSKGHLLNKTWNVEERKQTSLLASDACTRGRTHPQVGPLAHRQGPDAAGLSGVHLLRVLGFLDLIPPKRLLRAFCHCPPVKPFMEPLLKPTAKQG